MEREKVFCVNTMGLFSGDGTGCTARLLKKYKGIVWTKAMVLS